MNNTNINVTSDFWPKGFDGVMLHIILALIALSLLFRALISLYVFTHRRELEDEE